MLHSKVSPFPKSPSQIHIQTQQIGAKSLLATPCISQIELAPLSINIPLDRDDITPVKPVHFTTGVTFAPHRAIELPAAASFKKALSAQGQQTALTHQL